VTDYCNDHIIIILAKHDVRPHPNREGDGHQALCPSLIKQNFDTMVFTILIFYIDCQIWTINKHSQAMNSTGGTKKTTGM